ncbi:MAG: hypothetical protein EA358_08345 [Flavobacteriales bacterium]|nr:MAG: hypothetical protein EA358_08345 [Flavobacteriales bacterium]
MWLRYLINVTIFIMHKTTTPHKKDQASLNGPSEKTIKRLLHYSKSIRVLKMPDGKMEVVNPN